MRTGRAFPTRPIIGQRQALAVPPPVATRLIEPQVVTLVDEAAPRRRIRGGVVQSRWPGYQSAALPPTPRLIDPVVQSLVDETTPRRHTRGSVAAVRPSAVGVVVAPPRQYLQTLVPEAAPRRHPGRVVAPRWAAYQWVGLPPVTRLVEPIVQGLGAELAPRRHVHGSVIAPGVQAAAASAGAPPPPVTPPRTVTVLRAATPRRARSGHVTQLRVITAPVKPPRPVVIDLCPATTRRQQRGHVVVGRPVTSPVSPPRPLVMHGLAAKRTGRTRVTIGRTIVVAATGSAFSEAALTGYVTVGAQDGVQVGSSGQPGARATADPVSGATGQPGVGASGTVNL
jgi:hypothetical protein